MLRYGTPSSSVTDQLLDGMRLTMRLVPSIARLNRGHRDERGAALITVLLISIPLLMAGGSLILITSMSTANVTDAAAETKAYYAAEAGAQQVLGVLRGNVAPSPLFYVNPVGSVAPGNQITFRRAIDPSTSNQTSDSSGPRLSRWLTYDGTYTDRVMLVPDYTPLTGMAFSASLSDPDNSAGVSFSTSGGFTNYGMATLHQFGSSSPRATLTYQPQSVATITNSGNSTLGFFTITDVVGITTLSNEPFRLMITQTSPWPATTTINCTLSGTISSSTSFVVVTFPTQSNNLGAVYARSTNPVNTNGTTPIAITVTAPQPNRLTARITGFGPRAAQKQMQMLLS